MKPSVIASMARTLCGSHLRYQQPEGEGKIGNSKPSSATSEFTVTSEFLDSVSENQKEGRSVKEEQALTPRALAFDSVLLQRGRRRVWQ